MDIFSFILFIMVFWLALTVYLLPYLIAKTKFGNEYKTIFWLNLLFGWTGLIWLALIIWSCTLPNKELDGEDEDSNEVDISDEIRKFHDLFKDGLITEEEFNKKKEELLN